MKAEHIRIAAGIFFPRIMNRNIGISSSHDSNHIDGLIYNLTDQFKIRLSGSIFLAFASEKLPVIERKGLILFESLVTKVDDIVDSQDLKGVTSSNRLRQYLLSQDIKLKGNQHITVRQLLDCTLYCFPEPKQKVIMSFLNHMSDVDLVHSGRKELGTYSYKDACYFRETTNSAYANTGILLAEVFLDKFGSLTPAGFAAQMVDDLIDCGADAKAGTVNMFNGMATDVWRANGNPPGEELDYIRETIEHQKGTHRLLIRGRNPLERTKVAYHREFNQAIDQLPPSKLKDGMRFIGNKFIVNNHII